MSFAQRIGILVGLLALGLAVLFMLEPVPQDLAYHRFADTRSLWGIPNFGDVTSNIGFAVVGVLGVLALGGTARQSIFSRAADARPYLIFFVGVALVSLGSAYYHWAPSNERLLWDRLPMTIAFMAFAAAVVADRIDADTGNGWLLWLFLAAGFASLAYWDRTESLGRGDLRFYGFVQFFPMIALPVICWLFPKHRITAVRYLVWVVGWYGLSKVLEYFDGAIFDLLGHTISGHSLKHLAAAVATYVALRMVLVRRRTSPTG